MTSRPRPLPSRRRSTRRSALPGLTTVLLVVGGIVAVNLIIVAGFVGSRGDDGAPAIPTEIEQLIPTRNAQIRTQDDVGADLDDAYTGILLIDDVRIPEDQLKIEPALGTVVFRPGEGKEFTRLTEGAHRATIVFRPQDPNRHEPERSFTWQFTAS